METRKIVENTIRLVGSRYQNMPNDDRAIKRFIYELSKELDAVSGIEYDTSNFQIDHKMLRGTVLFKRYDSDSPNRDSVDYAINLL